MHGPFRGANERFDLVNALGPSRAEFFPGYADTNRGSARELRAQSLSTTSRTIARAFAAAKMMADVILVKLGFI